MTRKSRLDFDADFIEATREAEQGFATCRKCKKKGPFGDFIAVLYGGGLVYAMCPGCAATGHSILIRMSNMGIEVLGKDLNSSPLAIGRADMDILKKRSG